jgi:chitinase
MSEFSHGKAEDWAIVNGRYDLGIKNALVQAVGTGFTFPACSAAYYTPGGVYTGGSQVSYIGCVFED